jgi:hypothetical protein
VWVVGTNRTVGGFGIWRWTSSGWAPVPGGAIRIAVDPAGRPWVVNSVHQIYGWTGAGWMLWPGSANDVGVGANGSVWVVGTNSAIGGFGVWHWTPTGWVPLPSAGAVRIAVDPAGGPWVVSSTHQIFLY